MVNSAHVNSLKQVLLGHWDPPVVKFATPEEQSFSIHYERVMIPLHNIIHAIVVQRPLLCCGCKKLTGCKQDFQELHVDWYMISQKEGQSRIL